MTTENGQSVTSSHPIVGQHFQTPDWCCHTMVSMVPPWVHTVLEPTPGDGNLVRALQKRKFNVTAPSEFWSVTGTFDAIVMNPPFTPMSEGYRILDACMDMSDVIVALMPWLTIINSERRTARLMRFGLKEVRHLPRYTFEGSRVQCCILHLEKNFRGQTIFVV
jgi:hypothetical protein